MIYLKKFEFTSDEIPKTTMTCFNTYYPFGVLTQNCIYELEFDPITIFYGSNGCGKTTALNVIAEKLSLQRETLYNKSNFFDEYLELCYYEGERIPRQSKIITSDDVFDYMMNIRYLNEGIDRQRLDLYKEYDGIKFDPEYLANHKLRSLEDYEEYKHAIDIKKISKSQFIRKSLMPNVMEQSNGESGFMYFTSKIDRDALYLLDEPENSLSPEKQQDLLLFLQDSARFYNCQFIIATHSPFLLSLKNAKIYDFDANPCVVKKWTELKNVRSYYDFFKLHEADFKE